MLKYALKYAAIGYNVSEFFCASLYTRDANFYGLPVVTTKNCKNFQFSTDY